VPWQWWGPLYLYGILVVDGILLAAGLRALRCTTPAEVKESGASTLQKAGMFASLVVFTLSAIFL
jgi:geranylgeranylglycerol-phosphate geranylgeranyltransferase